MAWAFPGVSSKSPKAHSRSGLGRSFLPFTAWKRPDGCNPSGASRNRTMDDYLPCYRPRAEDDITRANYMWPPIKSAVRNLLHKQQVDSELSDEIESYVAAVIDEKIADGL